MRWTAANVPADKHPVRILEIQGTVGATPTIERKRGFEMLLAEHPDYSIVYSAGGDFTREGGTSRRRAVSAGARVGHRRDLFPQRRHGARRGRRARGVGIQPGRDVKIISVDGTEEAVKALEEGRLNCVVECSPLLGPRS